MNKPLNRGDDKIDKKIDWNSIVKIAISIFIPFMILVTLFNDTRFQVKDNTKDIANHEVWIQEQTKVDSEIKDDMSVIRIQQAVILEKIGSIEESLK